MKILDYIGLKAQDAENIVKELAQLLADYHVYYANLKGFHWNIKGNDFFTLHEQFENYYDDAEEKIDELAERMLALGGLPESRYSEYLKIAKVAEIESCGCPVKSVQDTLDGLKVLVAQERKVHDVAEAGGDYETGDMMVHYITDQQKTIWMLVAYLTAKPEH